MKQNAAPAQATQKTQFTLAMEKIELILFHDMRHERDERDVEKKRTRIEKKPLIARNTKKAFTPHNDPKAFNDSKLKIELTARAK